MHLEVRDVGVPVADVAEPARPRVEVLAKVAVGGRDPGRGRLAVRPEADRVDVGLGVVEARASRLPIPAANELSTVAWQSAQVMPIELIELPPAPKKPLTPTTAFNCSSASVVAGLSRSILLALP